MTEIVDLKTLLEYLVENDYSEITIDETPDSMTVSAKYPSQVKYVIIKQTLTK